MVFHGTLIPEERKRGWEVSDRKDIYYTETDSDCRGSVRSWAASAPTGERWNEGRSERVNVMKFRRCGNGFLSMQQGAVFSGFVFG